MKFLRHSGKNNGQNLRNNVRTPNRTKHSIDGCGKGVERKVNEK